MLDAHSYYFADSYVTLTFLNKENEILEKLKTKTRKGTLCPDFGDNLNVVIPDNQLPDVQVQVKLKTASRISKIKKRALIGETIIKPDSDQWKRLMSEGEAKGWFPLFKPKK